jgi:catechol 2,3-dioxygenase
MATYNNDRTPSDELAQKWPLRRVGLKVQDLSASLDYYTRLGLSSIRDESNLQGEREVGLGFGSQEVLSLRAMTGGRPRPAHTAGLYHFALLLPGEADLGSFLQHCLEQRIPLDGASDHLVSQAIYLSDPEGNGIEVYADRPREEWEWRDGRIGMDTLRLDAQALLKKAGAFDGFPAQSRLGHMHLNVGNLDHSMAFYRDLGMGLTTDLYNQARFLSWDGYHHHLGINLWAGRNASRVEPDVYGLDFFEIARPGLKPGTFEDPDGVKVIVAER